MAICGPLVDGDTHMENSTFLVFFGGLHSGVLRILRAVSRTGLSLRLALFRI